MFPPTYLSSQSSDLLAYKQYLQLRSVCSKFRTLFATHRKLTTDLVFCPTNVTTEGVRHFSQNLTQWLKVNSQITTMSAHFPRTEGSKDRTSLYQEPFFRVLDQCQVRLQSISLSGAAAFMTQVQAFATATTCHIRTPRISGFCTLELDDIVAMCNLESLTLQDGRYCSLTLPSSLTTLRVIDAGLFDQEFEFLRKCNWSQSDKLRHLTIIRGEVKFVHELGLCACTNLQKLKLQYARFMADTRVDSFVYGKGFPQGMSIASALTSLRVSLPEHSTFCQDVQCMSSLCRLDMVCQGTELSAALENLTNLTELRIQALVTFDHEKGCQDVPIVKVTFDWGQLRALQSIKMTGPATLGTSVTSVIALPQLRYFGLHKFWPGDLATELAVKHIEAVASSEAPQVLVEIS